MADKHLYYIEATIKVKVVLQVIGEDIFNAEQRAWEGAWHGVQSVDYGSSKVLIIGNMIKGPGVNR